MVYSSQMVRSQDTPAYFELTQIDMKVSNERGITDRKKESGGNIKTSGSTV